MKKKTLLISIIALLAIILAGLGIWDYTENGGNFFRFNQKANIKHIPEPVQDKFMDNDMNFMDNDMNFMDNDMNFMDNDMN